MCINNYTTDGLCLYVMFAVLGFKQDIGWLLVAW
jgi:hypothetical protein